MIKWGIIGFGSMGKQFASCFEDQSKNRGRAEASRLKKK